ncbi:hypothetical protein [Tomitella gaofuii]|uniref:hypothetical protein n=1 Tax=Tomitella gaofuii TaxID=2760083 RepID=UPI0015F7EC4A|nr:hypothetical protein [Tomitella gaofuii]
MNASGNGPHDHGDHGGAQISDEVREALAGFLAAVTPLVAQLAPGPAAPESSCTWCPLCALVALSKGQQHPLLTALGTQGVALLTALRDLLADSVRDHAEAGVGGETASGPGGAAAAGADGGRDATADRSSGGPARDGTADTGGRAEPPAPRAPRFEPITVTVDDPGDGDPP